MVGQRKDVFIRALIICGIVVAASAKPQNSGSSQASSAEPVYSAVLGKTSEVELRNGYNFNFETSPKASTSGKVYIEGRSGPGPSFLRDPSKFEPSDLWSGHSIDALTCSLYTFSVVVVVAALWYTLVPICAAKKSVLELEDLPKKSSSKKDKDSKVKDEDKEEIKSRRRRDVRRTKEADADLTRLASIVLNAVASGECLQKTICQIGSQIGTSSKGRLAFSLADTLLPPSIHDNQYFVTMKKALKGETTCERFNCKY